MRSDIEQLEFQRKNPHLFTTATQSVNPDGSITTFDEVTQHLRKQRDRLAELITEHDGTPRHYPGDGCMKEARELLTYISVQMKEVHRTFVSNYARFHEARYRANR